MIDKKRYILAGSGDSGWWCMVKLRCPRCGHVWEYRGNLVFATCPSCFKKIDVRKFREVESHES
jgi:rubrerythrin